MKTLKSIVILNILMFFLILPGCAGDNSSNGGDDSAPKAPDLTLNYNVKQLEFSWNSVSGAAYYQLYSNPDGTSGFSQVGENITDTHATVDITVYTHDWSNAAYFVKACNNVGCNTSNEVNTMDSAINAIGYFKASNTEAQDYFGSALSISGDGTTLVVGAPQESSAALNTDVSIDQDDNSAIRAGAAYVYIRDSGGRWLPQAYIKASNTEYNDIFGTSVALSKDGTTLAVGATGEDSSAQTINGSQSNNDEENSGAVYIFVLNASNNWIQQAYIKSSNSEGYDAFGKKIALSDDGNTLAVAAEYEDSIATDINNISPGSFDNSADNAGAVFIFIRDTNDSWSQKAYVKASNTETVDYFGRSLDLSGNGTTLAVGAAGEDSGASRVNNTSVGQADNSVQNSGAVYVFACNTDGVWSQQAYIKASNPGIGDYFGNSVGLNKDGSWLLVGAPNEDSAATGINDTIVGQSDNSKAASGAAYLFSRGNNGSWAQEAYIKASNSDSGDHFGEFVALSGDGNTLAIGSYSEDSSAVGLNGEQTDNLAPNAGAVYVFIYDISNNLIQQAYLKSSNTDPADYFHKELDLDDTGTSLAVGAYMEDGSGKGVNDSEVGQSDNGAYSSGAVYLF